MDRGHGWPIIKVGDEWYDTEPTWYDTNDWLDVDHSYPPYKISFEEE